MIEILIICLGAITPRENEIMNYILKNATREISVGLLEYDNINAALEDFSLIDQDKYRFYLVLGEKKKLLERQLRPDRLLGTRLEHYFNWTDKTVAVIGFNNSKFVDIANEGLARKITFYSDNYSGIEFMNYDIVIDEYMQLSAQTTAAIYIERILKEYDDN